MAQQHADAYPRKHFFFEMFTGLAPVPWTGTDLGSSRLL